jgi:hypothetical protein
MHGPSGLHLQPSEDREAPLGVSWVNNGAPKTLWIAQDDRRHEGETRMGREPPITARFPSCLFTPLVERQMILVDHQRSIRQICCSTYIEAAISLPLVGMANIKTDRYHCRITLGVDVQFPRKSSL